MKQRTRLQKAYARYQQKHPTKSSVLSQFVNSMPELIFRTTKLEGERVSRKKVNALFS